MAYTRYAVYYTPPKGDLAEFGAAWLGWDVARGAPAPHRPADVPGLPQVTQTPRKYGFHGTLKPPFRLAEGKSPDTLRSAVAELAQRTAPGRADTLELRALGSFLALTPQGTADGIDRVAAACVTVLDRFRAPAPPEELARRRKAGLSPRQEALLTRWGYPYVLDAFRFHMTLTGRLPKPEMSHWQTVAQTALPALPCPFVLEAISLVGERPDGAFELIERFALQG